MNNSERSGTVEYREMQGKEERMRRSPDHDQISQERDITDLFKHLTSYKKRILLKRLPILVDCLHDMRIELRDPNLNLWDMKQMVIVLLEGNLRDWERRMMINALFEQIYRNPQWNCRGDRGWIEKQIAAFRALKKGERGAIMLRIRETNYGRMAIAA